MKLSPILRMASGNFRALVTKAKKTPATIELLTQADFPTESKVKLSPGPCDTIVKVQYSNLNYKDALVRKSFFKSLSWV
jgi:NADPH:quinone reductase-like Zn-dependent oxidoreductase